MTYKVYFGSVNEDKFNEFIVNELIEELNPYPGERSILFIDNAGFNHNQIFLDVIETIGCMLAFLPHYEPIINLAEWVFSRC